MTEITLTIGRAEQLRDVLGSGIAIIQVIREAMDDGDYSDALHGAMMVLQQAYNMVDTEIERTMHE